MVFSFVILHYLTYEDTIECIESIIKNIKASNYNIVVVDNGSKNMSGDMLENKYKDHKNIYNINLENNLGFAQGNNIGYEYAKKELESDFIILINNDTLIEQKNFIDEVENIFREKSFHIMGPDILSTKDKLHQNPQKLTYPTEDEVEKMISRYKVHILLGKLGIEKNLVQSIKKIFKANKGNTQKNVNSMSWETEQANVQLHGSCLIFSPYYVEKYIGLYPDTFMYMEEDILCYIAEKEKLLMLYSPNVQILHKEDSSTDALFHKDKEKRIFKYRNALKSGEIFLNVMRNYDNCRESIIDRNTEN